MTELPQAEWDEFLSKNPEAHLLQTSNWGALKSDFGWDVARLVAGKIGAQILFRRLPLGFSMAYIPKGPLLCEPGEAQTGAVQWGVFFTELDLLCQRHKAIFLKIEPDVWENGAFSDKALPPSSLGLEPGGYSVQPRRTIVVDLGGSEERVLGRMKQKTRYNIRLALKKGVVVRPSADLNTFYRLIRVTGGRDAFGVHSLDYYRRAYELFHPKGECELLLAEYKGEPLAALMVFAHGSRAWYFYGASGNEHRERMPTYLLQWEAMRWARTQGCHSYDLWGVPDEDEQTLEAEFSNRSGGLWGVYRFKRGFGGALLRSSPPLERVYQPPFYLLYRWLVGRRSAD